jgi:hypothetical protein
MAFEISFMDAMAGYFDYEVVTLCGIPEIHLKGTQEDYTKILAALNGLRDFQLDWWIARIYPAVEQIINALNGSVDAAFWSSIYKQDSMSGGPFVTGWIADFFPYLSKRVVEENGIIAYESCGISQGQVLKVLKVTDLHYEDYKVVKVLIRNPRLAGDAHFLLKLDDFPNGLSVVPFKWNCLGEMSPMHLVAGFIGIKQDVSNYALKADINWLVSEHIRQ